VNVEETMKFRIIILSALMLALASMLMAQTVQKVAVLDFEAEERSVRTLANQIMDARRGDFGTIFDDYDQYELIDPRQVSRTLSDMNLESVRYIASAQAAEIGENLEADIVIWGTISDHSSTEIRVLANVMSVRTRTINQLRFNVRKRSADRRDGLKVELVDKIAELAGGQLNRLFEIGEQQVSANNYTAAGDTYRRIIEMDPQNLDAYFYLGYIEFMLNDYQSSEDYYKRGLQIDPENERILNNLAETQRLAGNYDDAIETLRDLARIKPSEVVWFRIGNIYAETNRLYDAIDAFERSLEIDPDYERSHYRLGVLLFDNDMTRESIPHLEYILERHPEDDLINRKLTSAYLRTGQLEQAITRYQNQIERDPQNVSAYLNLAGAYRTLERNSQALQTLETLMQFEENNPTVYIRMADVKIAQGNLNAAERDAQRAIELDPDLYESYMILSQIYQIRGYNEYEKFLNLEEEARGAFGSEANRLVAERDEARNEANSLFTTADQYLDMAAQRTGEPTVTRDITNRKQLLSQLIDETRRTFFD